MEEEKREVGYFQKILRKSKYLRALQFFLLKCQSGRLDLMSREFLTSGNGIGSSLFCDGQILVTDDLIGLNNVKFKFLKRFINIRKYILEGIKKFKKEVENKKYPSKKFSY